MKNNLIFAAALLACTPIAFAQGPSGDARMDTNQMADNQMADIVMEAPPAPDVVMVADLEAPQGVPPAPQQGPDMHGRGPQGEKHRGPDGPGMDRGIIPPGAWWQDSETVAAIGLSADQQKHIEDLFIQSRTQLIQLHANLETEQLQLEPVLNANPIDQAKALAVIDKIANSRAELEKANAKMLLSIRGVLTPEQWTKLQAQRPHGRGGPGGPDGKHGPRNRGAGQPPAPPTGA